MEVPSISVEYSEEELIKHRKWKDKVMMSKVVALDKMKKDPMTNPSTFRNRDKREFMCHIEFLMALSEEDLTNEFNEVCLDTVFSTNEYNLYPVYA